MLYIYIIIEQLRNFSKNEFFLESILTRFYFLLLLRTLTVENELCGTSELGIWLREWKAKVLQFILFRHNRLTSLKRTIFQTCIKMNEKNEKKLRRSNFLLSATSRRRSWALSRFYTYRWGTSLKLTSLFLERVF